MDLLPVPELMHFTSLQPLSHTHLPTQELFNHPIERNGHRHVLNTAMAPYSGNLHCINIDFAMPLLQNKSLYISSMTGLQAILQLLCKVDL